MTYIISLDDRIRSKLWWASASLAEKQLTDVRNLLRNENDGGYIEQWADKLEIADLLDGCRKEIE